MTTPRLTNMILSPKDEIAEFIAKLGTSASMQYVKFRPWWEAEVVYFSADPGGFVLKRKDLVLAAVNSDGGAHVDSAFNAEYRWVLEGAGWSIQLNPDNAPSKSFNFKYAHLSAIRQIGYEVLNSPELQALQK